MTGQDPRRNITLTVTTLTVDRIDLKKIMEEVVGLEEITVSQPEVEFDDDQQQSYEQDLTNLLFLEWLNEKTLENPLSQRRPVSRFKM